MWQRQTQPSRLLGHERVQRGGLRVVDEADVPAADELARVHLVVALPGVPLLVGEVLGRALQRVVHQLGRVEELLAAVDDLPLDSRARRPSSAGPACRGSRSTPPPNAVADRWTTRVPSAARRARGSPRSSRGRRCGCSRQASCADGDGLEHGAVTSSRVSRGRGVSTRAARPSLTRTVRRLPSRQTSSVTVSPGS